MTDLLRGLDCKVWVDDVFYFAEDEIYFLCLLDEIFVRLESVGLFVAAHKCTFFGRELVLCGKVYSDGVVSHDPARIQGLSNMGRPQTASEIMQFLQAANCFGLMMTCFVCVSGIVMFCGFRLGIRLFKFD